MLTAELTVNTPLLLALVIGCSDSSSRLTSIKPPVSKAVSCAEPIPAPGLASTVEELLSVPL